ncbi:MAG: 23S rRNA (adenine(2503)-C(2))-methyltransferase RlmN [Deltaproteobacteria bacterium]
MKNLRDMTYEDMLSSVSALDEKPYRAEQIYGWTYNKAAASVDGMTDISKGLREKLKDWFCIAGIEPVERLESSDGTVKFLSRLEDGKKIESVIIPEGRRLTLCVSSQAGCAFACAFCRTGKAGLSRNLHLSELASQVIEAKRLAPGNKELTNIVLMGMGEPLANYGNVVKFLNILVDPKGFGFSHNRVTVSTCGVVPAIKKLAHDADVNLAVSLSATTDEVRDILMPINRKYPLALLMESLKAYPRTGKKRHITIEYVLIKGLNDSPADASRLIRLLSGIKCKVNIIPFNTFAESSFEPPADERLRGFHNALNDAGVTALIRTGKGIDIQAACGTLAGGRDIFE